MFAVISSSWFQSATAVMTNYNSTAAKANLSSDPRSTGHLLSCHLSKQSG